MGNRAWPASLAAEERQTRWLLTRTRRQLVAAREALATVDQAAPDAAMATARAALDAALRDQDKFLHAAAHDLRNPLTALRGQVQLLQRRSRRAAAAGADVTWSEEGLAAIDETVTRFALLVDHLLDAAWEEDGAAPDPDGG